ncbi:hypothetical protein ACIBO1_20535 [Micromonospora sp. NPDC049903]|uniref:hypothetical protein n=1 Tax=Micromonospora sp. NPDC049903 TaxID=3364276 RepID=UPI00378DC091
MRGGNVCKEIMVVPGRFVLTGAMTQERHSTALAVSIATPPPADGTLVHLIEESPRSAVGLDHLRSQPFTDAMVLVPGDVDRWATGARPLPDDPEALGGLADLYRMQVQVPVGSARSPQIVPVGVDGRESSWTDADAVRVLPWSQVAGRAVVQAAYARVVAGEEPGRRRLDGVLADLARIQQGLRVAIPPGSLAAAVHLGWAGTRTQAAELVRRVLPVAVSELPEVVGEAPEAVDATVLLDALRDNPGSAALTWIRQPGGAPTVAWLLGDGAEVRWIGALESQGAGTLIGSIDDRRLTALRGGLTAVLLDSGGVRLRPARATESIIAQARSAPASGQVSDVVRPRLAELRRMLIERSGELTKLRSEMVTTEADRDAGSAAASAEAAGLTGRERTLQAEIARLRARITELTRIAADFRVEATEIGLVSQIRVRQWRDGGPGWLVVPVLVDGTGVHGLHPETHERTGDFRLVDGEWRARLRGGSGMPGEDFRQDDEFWEGMWVGDRASLPGPMDVDATVDPALLPVVDPVSLPVLDSDKHWQPPQRAAFVGTLSTTGKLAVMGRLVKLRPVSRSTTVGYWTDDTRVWVQLPDGGRVMVVYPHPVFGLRGTRTRIVEGWRRVPGVEATAVRRGIPDSKGRLSVDGRRITLNGLGGTEVEYRYDATTVWLLLPDGRKIMATHSHPVFDPAAAGPVTEAGWSREPGETATWHSGKMSGSRFWVNHRRVVLGSDVYSDADADADVRYTYDATTVWLILSRGQQIMVTYPYPAFYPAGASPVVEEGWPREPSGTAAMARLGTAGDSGLDVDGRDVPLWPTQDESSIRSQVAYRFDETTVWVRWRDGRKVMVTYPHPVFGPAAAGRVVVDGWRDPNYLMVSDNWPEPGGGPMELDESLQATVVPVGSGEPSRLRGDGWIPPQEAASSAMLHSGTMSVKGRSVRLPTTYGDTEVTYWADDTRLWVLLPDGRKAMVVYPNPVFGSGYDQSTVIGSWEWQPSGLAAAARPGTLDRQKRLAVDGRVVLLAGHLEAKAEVEYRYDATTVWVRSQDGREVMVTYPYPIFDPAAAGPLMVEGWPQQPNAIAEFRSSKLVQGQVRVNNRVVQLGRKYPDSPLDYAYDATTVWVRLANGRKVMVTYPYPVFDPADRKPEVEAGWPREPSAQAAMARLGTVSAVGQISVDRLLLYFGKKIGGTSSQGPVAYRFDETTVWVRWRDGRKAMVTFPYPAAAPAAAGPVVVDGWRDPNYLMVSDDWDGGPADRGENPVSLDVLRRDEEFRADVWHGNEEESLPVPMDAPATPAASVSDAEASDDEPSRLREDPWQPPQSAPSTGKIRNRNLPVKGRDVRLRSSHAGATVDYWADGTTVWVRLPGDERVMVVYPNPIFSPSSDKPRVLRGWLRQPSELAAVRTGTVTAQQDLVVDNRRVALRGHIAAKAEVEYRYDATTVWVRSQDGREAMVAYPYPTFDPAAAGPEVVAGWPRQPSLTAEFDTTKLSGGRLWVNNRRVDLGSKRFPDVEVEYTYDATTVWVRWPDGSTAMATSPSPIFDPAGAGRVVVEGWLWEPSATAKLSSGRLSKGRLRVDNRVVRIGTSYPDATVELWSDMNALWVRWTDGRKVMATYPYPVFDPTAGRPVVVQGWPREPSGQATAARLTTLEHNGRLQVGGRRVELRQVGGELTPGLVAYRYDATTVWVRARNGRKAQVTYPYAAFDPGTAGPVLVQGWRDPNHLMDDPVGPDGLLDWDGSPVDPAEDPVSFDVLRQDDDYWNGMWQGGETASSAPTDPGGTMDPAAMSVVSLADLSMADAPTAPAAGVGDAETVVGEPSQPRDERWQPPREAPSVGKLRNGNLSVRGRDVRMGSRVGGVTVDFWADGTTAWVRLPNDKKVMIVYPNPVFTSMSVRPRVLEGWLRQPSDLAVARTGTVTANGALTIDGRRIELAKRVPAKSEAEYWYDATTVWVRTPDGSRVMVVFPYPVFDPAAAGPEVVEGWPRQPSPTAEFDTTKLSAGRFWVNFRRIDLGLRRFPDTTIEYTFDDTTVWVRLPDGRQAMVAYPKPVLDPASAGRAVVEGWPRFPGVTANSSFSLLSNGRLRLNNRVVPLGVNYPDGFVELWSDADTVWARWPDGREVMATYPYPIFDPTAGRAVVKEDWSREPDGQATAARLGTIDKTGRLQVDGRQVHLRGLASGDLPSGPVAYRYDATTLWVRARNGKKAQVTYPYAAFDAGTAGPVIVNGWRDPNHLMDDPVGPDGLLDWDGSPVDPAEDPLSFDGPLEDDEFWDGMWLGGAEVPSAPVDLGGTMGPTRLLVNPLDLVMADASVVPAVGDEEAVPDQVRDRWQPPEGAPSNRKISSGRLPVRGRDVWVRSHYGDVRVDYWADGTTVWVRLPGDEQVMVVYPNPVFRSSGVRPRVEQGWPSPPSEWTVARTGTLNVEQELVVDNHRVGLRVGIAARSVVEYWYDATTVWVRSQDGRKAMLTYPSPTFDPAAVGPEVVRGWPLQPSVTAEFDTATLSAGRIEVDGRRVQLGSLRSFPAGTVEYTYDATTVWFRWRDGRKAMVAYPSPVFDPAYAGQAVAEGWPWEPTATAKVGSHRLSNGRLRVDGRLVQLGRILRDGDVDVWSEADTLWVRRTDGTEVLAMYPYPVFDPTAGRLVVEQGWSREPGEQATAARLGTVGRSGRLHIGGRRVELRQLADSVPPGPVAYRFDATTVWVRGRNGQKAQVTYPYPAFDPADVGPVQVDGWRDPNHLMDDPVGPDGLLDWDGSPVDPAEDPVSFDVLRQDDDYWDRMWQGGEIVSSASTGLGGTMDPAAMSMVSPADLSMADAPAVSAVGVGDAEAVVGEPSQLSEERWQPPKETASAGRLSTTGTLMVMGREVRTKSRYANVWAEYWTDDTTVWVLLPDGDRFMVVYPQSVFGPPGVRSTFVQDWLREPSTQATAARRGLTNSAGRLVIDGRKVSVGRYRHTEVEYRYDATTVWFALPGGKRAMATYPYSALIPAAAGPAVEDGWPRQPDATTEWGTGKLSRGELWVNDRRVKFGDEKYPDAQVLYAFDATTVWLTLPDGRQAMATFPYPAFYPIGAEPVVVQGWPREPGPGAATARRGTVTHGGHLSVDGRTIALGETIDGTSTEGLVGLRFDATAVWVRWRDGRRAMVTFPYPVFDPAAAGPVLVDGWRDPNLLMSSDRSPEWDGGPATSLPVSMDSDEPLNATVRPAVNWAGWPPPEEAAATGELRNGKLTIQGRVVQLRSRHGSGTVEYWTDDKTVWVRLPDGDEAMVVYPNPTFGTSGAVPTLAQGWPQQPGDLAAATRSGRPDSGGQLRLDGRRVSLGAHFAAGDEVEYRYDATTVWARSPGGTEVMVSYPFPVFDPAAVGPVVEDGWSRQPDPSARFIRAALKQKTLKANNRFVRIGERYPDATVDYTVDATTVWVRWPDGRKATVTFPYPVFDPAERKPVVVEGWPQEPSEQATPARLGTISAAGQMSVDKLMVYFGQRIGGRSPQAVVAYRFDATTVWVRWRDGRKAMVAYPYPALTPAAVGPVVVDGWRDPNYLMVSDDWPEHDGGRVNPREEPVSLGPPVSAQSAAAVHESAAVAEVSVGRGRRGVADDRGVVVVGEMARWREWSQASAVVAAARSSARPVVVVDAGEGLGPRSAVLSALGMVLLQFGRRRQQPLVVATGLVSEVTTVVGRYGLPVIGPDGAGPDARWQVVGPDGVVHWSARAFSMASFAAAGEVSSNAVQRADSEVLTQWLAQPDWPAAESFLRENTGDLLHPQIRQELVQLGEQDPANRLLPVFTTILDMVGENSRAVDPADSRYRAPMALGPYAVEPFDGVRGPLSVTFALDYLEPKPDPAHRKPWDDRLLRLMYLDPRARDRARLLAAGVLGEQRGRVDDGRWNATVFGAVTTALGMTVEQAEKPWPVGAWGKALEEVACCEANPEHRTYWIPRMDELRDLVSVNGIPGWIDGPAPAHGQLLEVLTETLASC